MNFKTTITLLFLLVILAGGSYFLGIFSPKSETQKQPKVPVVQAPAEVQKDLLIAPAMEDVQRVRLQVAGRDEIVFERTDKNWNIVKPVDAPAMLWEVSDLIEAFTTARKIETLTPGQGQYADQTIESLGLKDPFFTVTLEAKDRKVTYLVGQTPAASESTYVKTPESNEVYIVDQNLKNRIKKNIEDYRDKQLWELNKSRINEMTFAAGDGRVYKFVKLADGKWNMVSPVDAPVLIGSVTQAIDAIATIKAQEFVENAPISLDTFGLAKPVWTITVVETQAVKPTTQSAQASQPAAPTTKRIEHVLLVGATSGLKSDQVYAKPADKKWVVTLAQDNLKKLIPDVIAWREKTLVELNKDALTGIDIRRSAQDVTLFREGENWKLQTAGEVLSADPDAVKTLIDNILGLQATSFIDAPNAQMLKKSRLDEPTCTITLQAGKASPVVLTIGDKTPSGMFRYVKLDNRNYVAVVANEKVEKLFTPALSYRDRQIMAFGIDSAVQIEIKRHDRTYSIVRAGANLPWKVTSPVEAVADQQNVRNILMALSTLRADDYVAQGYLGNYDLESPQILVHLKVEMQVSTISADATTSAPAAKKPSETQTVSQEFTLAVSKYHDKVYAVRLGDSKPLVAVVPEQLLKDLSAEFIARSAFGADVPVADEVDHLTIIVKKEAFELEKKNGQWTLPADPVVQIDQTKVGDLLRALASLKVIRYSDLKSKDGLKQVSQVVKASKGEKSWTLEIGRTDRDENYVSRTSSLAWLFELSAGNAKKFAPSLKDLIAAPEKSAEPDAEPTAPGNY
jgi:hypothetical protein